MKTMKKVWAVVLCAAMLSGCSTTETATTTTESATAQTLSETTVLTAGTADLLSLASDELFTGNDYEVGLVFDTESTITLANNGSTADDSSVTISGNVITITQEGSYRVSGSLSEGQLVIDVDESEKVQLILDGVTITNTTTAAIYAPSCDKLFVTLEGTNTLTSTIVDTEDSNVDSALFAQGDMTLNGAGSLTITTTNGNGITSKDDLVFTGGLYTITADGHGLDANNSIRIASGTFTMDTGKDGMHADDEDVEKGYIFISDGTFTITALGDGLDSSSQVQIDGGDFDITTGGGSALNLYTGQSQTMGSRTTTTTQTMEVPEMTERTDMADMADMGELPEMTERTDMMQSGMDTQMQSGMMQGQMSGQMGMAGGVSATTTGGTVTTLAGGQMGGQMQSGMMSGQSQMGMDTMMQGQMGMEDLTDEEIAAMEEQMAMMGEMQMGMDTMIESTTSASDLDDSLSTKGIKASTYILINGGTINLDTFDDAIHSNGNTYIAAGTLTIAAGDDAIHSDWNTTIADGDITITTCYEGLEGQQVEVLGGVLNIYALDDGFNAAKSDNAMDGDIYIRIAGGTIDLDTYYEGDGIDSNGYIEMSGGILRVSGTTATTDTPLDYGSEAWITGGIFMIGGSVSQTSQNFGEDSTQGAIWVALSSVQTGTFTLTDSAGNVVAEYTPTKEYQTVGISTPDIVVGETYTLVAGSETFTIEMESLIYGEGNEGSMMGGQMSGMSGRR
ncbi:carbohydrate-binding domain-containing protein [Bengtsoniella intestinalis]|uniref:carbohydrate-binding domain-containing protein n=1 Tax=Bengtsoniella intestinalis TaxID=3073143 RepID=UPI00391F9011